MVLCLFVKKDHISKIVSVNCITCYIVVTIAMMVVLEGIESFFLDIAAIYGSLGFVSSMAFLKFFRRGRV
jgi:multisubunit Na+/H+ antiporter MnhF subunit